MRLRKMLRGGMPLERDAVPPEVWSALGALAQQEQAAAAAMAALGGMIR